MIDAVIAAPTLVEVRRPLMSWLSIVGGWLVALGIAWLFYVLGLAVGFSGFDVSDPQVTAKGLGIGTTLWVVLTWAISLFLGGMFASWMDGRPDQTVGALHGIAVWGLAMSVTVLLAAIGSNNLLQGGASLLRAAATAGAISTASIGANGEERANADTPFGHATGALGAEVKRAVTQAGTKQLANVSTPPGNVSSASTSAVAAAPATTATGDQRSNTSIDRATSSAVAIDLLRGKTDDAKARLAADAGLQPAEADAVVQSLSPQIDKYKAELKEAANQMRRYTAAALWAIFFSSLIALVAAAFGGWAGAGHIHRVHDQRPYP